jgi:hypothetical protein
MALVPLGTARSADQDYERDPINYWKVPLTDAVSTFRGRLERSEVRLDSSSEKAWLHGVLAALEVPVSSQVLVFSKTSLQRSRIAPETPRAIFFSDEVYVGWVPGGAIELSAIDPNAGPVFFLLERPGEGQPPRFERSQDCLNCHAGPMTGNVPGFMIRSVYPDATGDPILSAGTRLTGHHSPLEERWGGWYVTGTHDPMRHMGNATATASSVGVTLDARQGLNLRSLTEYFDVSRYPLDQSDIVALMVLEHQVNMHTVLARAHVAVRTALHRHAAMLAALDPSDGLPVADSARRVIEVEAERVVKHLLFADEARLASEGVASESSFAEDFVRSAPAARDGQSLKSLRLGSRMFDNRCSYLIYSKSFDHLPPELAAEVAARLREALVGDDRRGLGAHIPAEEKARIARILRETKPSLASGW